MKINRAISRVLLAVLLMLILLKCYIEPSAFIPPINPVLFNPNLSYGTMTDQDGNIYKTIKIGNQTWMAAVYGHLYNWYAVCDNRNIAPVGWHVSTDTEWTILIDYLGGDSIAGDKLKENGKGHWINPGAGTSNQSGFTALPGGDRWEFGEYSDIGYVGLWWSVTEVNPAGAGYVLSVKFHTLQNLKD